MKNKLYYSIGEVCEFTGVKPSVVRFWETKFPNLKPYKSPSGRRYYTSENVELLNLIKQMLYEEKLTIEGAKKRLKDKKNIEENKEDASNIQEIKKTLEEILEILS